MIMETINYMIMALLIKTRNVPLGHRYPHFSTFVTTFSGRRGQIKVGAIISKVYYRVVENLMKIPYLIC